MKKICYLMGPDCCSMVAGRNCPTLSGQKEDDVYWCFELSEALRNNGWNEKQAGGEPYGIILHPCGRYTISAGQHRFCIMRKEKIDIPKVYEKLIGPCRMHHVICDKYLSKIDKDLYVAGDLDYVVDGNGKVVYCSKGILNRIWYTLLMGMKVLLKYINL